MESANGISQLRQMIPKVLTDHVTTSRPDQPLVRKWNRTNFCLFLAASVPGARFSKVPKTFRARKAICKTPTRLFCKADPFIFCKENNNNWKVSCLKTPSFWRYKDNYVTRNAPEKFWNFREKGPWIRSGSITSLVIGNSLCATEHTHSICELEPIQPASSD